MTARHFLCCLILATGLTCPVPARAQSLQQEAEIAIGETIWGFDGKAVRETFTPLSILIQNHGPKPAQGILRIERQTPLEVAREPAINVPFDIPPFDERWVQTAIYMIDDFAPWQMSWGPSASQTAELSQPRLGEAAAILLVNPDDRPRSSGALRRFRTNLFPPIVTATDGLNVVFLNSVPDLQGARLQSFLEWLHGGGSVVLLHGDDQQFPRFPSALDVLNNPAERFRAGGGEVSRLPLEAKDVDAGELRLVVHQGEEKHAGRETTAAFQNPYMTYNGRYPWGRDRSVLERLEVVSRFHRRWWLIYPLALLYLLAVFPGSYALAHTPGGVKRFYIAYFSTALAFSWAFSTLGGVGGGAANRIRSATVATQLSPGIFDCSQWACLAAVDGGWYSFSHEASGRCYSHCEEFETPRGLITAGPEARYEVDIPVASTRTAVCRFRATASPVKVEIRSSEFIDQKLNRCELVLGGLPDTPLEVFVCHRDSIMRLEGGQGRWSSDRRQATPTSVFITNLDRVPNYMLTTRGKQADDNVVTDDFYRSLERRLVGNAFEVRGHVEPWSARLPAGLLRVLALVDADEAFAGKAPGFTDVQGCVLYVIDLPVSEN